MVANLVHENLMVRKTSIHTMAALLKQNKRLHPKMERKVEDLADQTVQPGNRPDNEWLQYKEDNRPTNKEEWNRPNFVQKTHFGYYHWPQPLLIVSNDTVLEQEHRVKKICRKELKLELLEKHSDVKFDPALHEACKLYLNKHCADPEHQAEDGGLECLKGSKKVRIEP